MIDSWPVPASRLPRHEVTDIGRWNSDDHRKPKPIVRERKFVMPPLDPVKRGWKPPADLERPKGPLGILDKPIATQ